MSPRIEASARPSGNEWIPATTRGWFYRIGASGVVEHFSDGYACVQYTHKQMDYWRQQARIAAALEQQLAALGGDS